MCGICDSMVKVDDQLPTDDTEVIFIVNDRIIHGSYKDDHFYDNNNKVHNKVEKWVYK